MRHWPVFGTVSQKYEYQNLKKKCNIFNIQCYESLACICHETRTNMNIKSTQV